MKERRCSDKKNVKKWRVRSGRYKEGGIREDEEIKRCEEVQSGGGRYKEGVSVLLIRLVLPLNVFNVLGRCCPWTCVCSMAACAAPERVCLQELRAAPVRVCLQELCAAPVRVCLQELCAAPGLVSYKNQVRAVPVGVRCTEY